MTPQSLGPMDMPTMTQPSYNGLRGDELLEVIVHNIKAKLSEHASFTAGIAHHSPKFNWVLNISSSPYEPVNTHVIEGDEVKREDDGEPPPGAVEQAGKFEISKEVKFPDKEREDAGLVVPDLQGTGDGSLSDYAENPFPAPQETEPEEPPAAMAKRVQEEESAAAKTPEPGGQLPPGTE